MPAKTDDALLFRRMITAGELLLALQRVPADTPVLVLHDGESPRGLERVIARDAKVVGYTGSPCEMILVLV